MEIEDYYKMLDLSRRRINNISLNIKRFLLGKIDWRDRLISIMGSRGTGKTTLILQHIKETFSSNMDLSLYVSMDNLWFESHPLPDLIETHYKNGGTHVFIDEIHYLQNWQKIIKNLYDDYPDLHIVYTGSSLLKIDYESGDLSRRQITYTLPGLSFREYLYFEDAAAMEAVSLPDLLQNHVSLASELAAKVKIFKYFNEKIIGLKKFEFIELDE